MAFWKLFWSTCFRRLAKALAFKLKKNSEQVKCSRSYWRHVDLIRNIFPFLPQLKSKTQGLVKSCSGLGVFFYLRIVNLFFKVFRHFISRRQKEHFVFLPLIFGGRWLVGLAVRNILCAETDKLCARFEKSDFSRFSSFHLSFSVPIIIIIINNEKCAPFFILSNWQYCVHCPVLDR